MLELAADSVAHRTDAIGAISIAQFGVESSDLAARVLGVGDRIRRQVDGQLGNIGTNRRLVATALLPGRTDIYRAGGDVPRQRLVGDRDARKWAHGATLHPLKQVSGCKAPCYTHLAPRGISLN